jgi:hypothetical protein
MMQHRGYAAQIATGPSTFDPATISGPITLSGGNDIATSTASSAAHVKGTLSHASGKWYLRYTVGNRASAFTVGAGFATGAASGYIGSTGDSFAIYDNGQLFQFGSGGVLGPSFTTGSLIEICLDIDNALLWWRVNGGGWSRGGDPATGSLGTPCSGFSGALFPAAELDANTDSITIDTSTASPITGFTAWG